MTTRKSFKSRVRARMAKTGESYTTARRHLLATAEPATGPAAAPGEAPPEAIRGNRVSDDVVRARTGRGWDEWFALLDGWDATRLTHPQIARRLVEDENVPGWWSQSITVAYEQARGLRVPGQQSDGSFGAGAGRTVDVPADRAFAAFTDPGLRARWLPGRTVTVRTATPGKSFRADWEDGATRIAVWFTPKSDTKTQIAVAHEKVTDPATAAALKAFWRERLTALKHLLEA
ncbi:SRPBCC family protein [Thermomonospora amylolytica]|uniref:hypothetical protein n=1 Tax=Thermomonospora amylolytica TaxID=1411117 RepID=UPI000E6D4B7B|nr:hypothetical protein [Thermomonospora amylolytica]